MRVQQFLASAGVCMGLTIPCMAQNGAGQNAQGPFNIQVANVTTSYLGVNLQDINGDRAKALKLPEEIGVEITRVEANSPASTAGLQPGDAVVEYNGQRVEGIEQFSRMVRETPGGRDVRLKVYRNGTAQTIMAKIGSHNANTSIFNNGQLQVPPAQPLQSLQLNGGWPDSLPSFFSTVRSSSLGLEAEALNGQLADYFGVKEGVLVRSVTKDSAADKAGIKAGDVITKVGDSTVATPGDLTSRIRPTLRRQAVTLTLMREKKEITVTVPGSEAPERGPRALQKL